MKKPKVKQPEMLYDPFPEAKKLINSGEFIEGEEYKINKDKKDNYADIQTVSSRGNSKGR